MHRLKTFIWGFSLFLGASVTIAGSTDGQFVVQIILNQPSVGGSPSLQPGVCVSEALSEQTGALVRVVCRTAQFVSITPLPGKPPLAAQGGESRHNIDAGQFLTTLVPSEGSPSTGIDTVTGLHIYNAIGLDGPLEMLVKF